MPISGSGEGLGTDAAVGELDVEALMGRDRSCAADRLPVCVADECIAAGEHPLIAQGREELRAPIDGAAAVATMAAAGSAHARGARA
jgi:hypothetical protein